MTGCLVFRFFFPPPAGGWTQLGKKAKKSKNFSASGGGWTQLGKKAKQLYCSPCCGRGGNFINCPLSLSLASVSSNRASVSSSVACVSGCDLRRFSTERSNPARAVHGCGHVHVRARARARPIARARIITPSPTATHPPQPVLVARQSRRFSPHRQG